MGIFKVIENRKDKKKAKSERDIAGLQAPQSNWLLPDSAPEIAL